MTTFFLKLEGFFKLPFKITFLLLTWNTQETYSLLLINNILLLVIIYIVITIASYLLYSSNLSSYFNFNFKNKGGSVDTNYTIKEELNPQVISKINDNFDIGLDPFNSDNDTSSLSSISSNNSI